MSAATEIAKQFEHASNNSDVDAIGACYAPTAVQHHPLVPAPNEGRDAIKAFEGGMFASFSEIDFEVQRVVDGGEWAAIELVVQATNTSPLPLPTGEVVPPTNARVRLPMVNLVRLDEDGLIGEEHRYFDVASMLGQLGLIG